MPKNTHPSIAMFAKWNNAVAMAAHSLVNEGDVSGIVPKNFTNGKNAAPRGTQNYDLSLMQFVEGYSTNLWGTPRQITEIGGVVADDCPKATIFIKKTSKSGNDYYQTYKLVNLDEVSFPNGITDAAYEQLIAASQSDDEYEVPTPSSFSPDYSRMSQAPKESKTAPKTLPANVPAPTVKRSNEPRPSNIQNPRHPHDFTPTGRPANVRVDMDELGLHFEARTIDECQILMERTLKQYAELLKLKATLN